MAGFYPISEIKITRFEDRGRRVIQILAANDPAQTVDRYVYGEHETTAIALKVSELLEERMM